VFEEFLGIPAHPLLVHGAVVFVPLQVLAAIAYGLWPFARRHIGWLMLSLAVVGPVAAWLARLSGQAFKARLIRNGTSDATVLARINEHQGLGNWTSWLALALGVLMIVMFVVLRGSAGAAGASSPALSWIVTGLTVLVGLGAMYYVVRTGDTGAHSAWKGF
jgi:hypothetical protein